MTKLAQLNWWIPPIRFGGFPVSLFRRFAPLQLFIYFRGLLVEYMTFVINQQPSFFLSCIKHHAHEYIPRADYSFHVTPPPPI
jgi:hypothetical protein